MKTKTTLKIIFIICMSLSLFACVWSFYKAFIETGVKSGKIVTEILSMKVSKIEIDTLRNDIDYHYTIENKYKIDIYRELPEVFESVGRYFVFIKDIDGNLVFTYDTKYPKSSLDTGRTKDYNKLMEYLKLN